jgi:hypothetical protein
MIVCPDDPRDAPTPTAAVAALQEAVLLEAVSRAGGLSSAMRSFAVMADTPDSALICFADHCYVGPSQHRVDRQRQA